MSILHPKDVIDILLAKGMTQCTIAALAGTTQATVCRIHKGAVADPRWSQVHGLNALYQAITEAERSREGASA